MAGSGVAASAGGKPADSCTTSAPARNLRSVRLVLFPRLPCKRLRHDGAHGERPCPLPYLRGRAGGSVGLPRVPEERVRAPCHEMQPLQAVAMWELFSWASVPSATQPKVRSQAGLNQPGRSRRKECLQGEFLAETLRERKGPSSQVGFFPLPGAEREQLCRTFSHARAIRPWKRLKSGPG